MATDPDAYTFRQARPEDAPRFAALDRALFPGYPFPERYIRWHLEVGISSPLCEAPDGELLGFAMMDVDPRSAMGLLMTIDVAPTWRRRGIGSALLGICADRLVKAGGRRMLLTVASRNREAIGFYESKAFLAKGSIPDYYPDDDALVLVHESPGDLVDAARDRIR